MKKIIVIVVLGLLVAAAMPALDFYLGGNAYYASAIQPSAVKEARTADLAASDFALGAEGRLYLNSITGSAVAVFLPGSDFMAPRLRIMTDVGLSLKLAIFRAGIGIGPDFGVAFGDSTDAARLGGNLRVTGDVVLGDFSIGLSWFSLISFTRQSIGDAFRNPYGFLGVSALFKL